MKREKGIRRFPDYIDTLQSKGQYWFLRSQVQKELGLTNTALRSALHRLARKKRICHIGYDFCVIVPIEHQAGGCIPALWFIDALMKHLKLPYYVGLLSAASLTGAAHQQVMTLQVITTKPLRTIVAGNQRIAFYYKQTIPTELLVNIKTPMSYCNVPFVELTAYDLVRYLDQCGQINAVATVLYELAENINVNKLIEFLDEKYVLLPVAQRLGYILENIQAPLNLLPFAEHIESIARRYVPLVGRKNPVINKNKKWHILVDEMIELDDL
jgi:predicted transcriptional regulator of viral defense system